MRADFARWSEALGKRSLKRIANNTWLSRLDDDRIGLCLHRTNVIIAHRSGTVTYHTGGWRSVTTKRRLNQFGLAGVHVYQRRHEWFVSTADGEQPFAEGVDVAAPTPKQRCLCADEHCPHCRGECCPDVATCVVYRIDMEDRTGTPMCSGCADDALESGLFTTEGGAQ